ncbi:MAG TPA: hypothetical protein VFV10_08585 [Gammaproteobacteria bacterium]|nr:hypothetical protein [Gammaproteobacteria bacterium]
MSDKGDDLARDLEQRVEAIESGYEFMLAYAAQGRETDRGAGSGRQVREYLDGMRRGLEGLADVVRALVAARDEEGASAAAAFLDAIERDAAVAAAAIRLVLRKEDIGSQLVDNLNACIHLRALLTDLFIVDEWRKNRTGRGG